MLFRLSDVYKSYGAQDVLRGAALQVNPGEHVGLVGRNGEGKSSLLRLLRHQAEPDAGSVWLRPGARVAHLAQDIDLETDETVAQIVTGGLPQQGAGGLLQHPAPGIPKSLSPARSSSSPRWPRWPWPRRRASREPPGRVERAGSSGCCGPRSRRRDGSSSSPSAPVRRCRWRSSNRGRTRAAPPRATSAWR